MYYVIGLGNPGSEYDNTRHNTGRMAAELFAKENSFPNIEEDRMFQSHVAVGKVGKEKVTVLLPDTFMNKSGAAVSKLKDLKPKTQNKMKVYENLIVIHDDLDLPIGRMKISFNKSSGGHKGVESIIKVVKSEAFMRVRIGISPETAGGKLKKPHGDEVVGNFILAKFKPAEIAELKKVFKKSAEAIAVAIAESREKAMSQYNS
jgi:PTH1 family peptidyl-tRNA hydrolase